MKKPRRRFTTEESIVKAIDSLQAQILRECKEAEEKDALATELFKGIAALGDTDKLKGEKLDQFHADRAVAKEARRRADLLRRVQGRRTKQMEKLKATWGEFKTQPMPFLTDASVALAKL